MDNINVIARAKVNLSLEVKGKRDDGYHLLSMVMQTIELNDRLKIAKNSNKNIVISSDSKTIPCDDRNIAFKAAKKFLEAIESDQGYDIFIEKNIPVEAGMGGGSADAAGVLVGLNKMNGDVISIEKLMEIGLELGADVPFCIVGGTKLAEGIGEEFTELKDVELKLLIVKPNTSISTAQAFRKLRIDKLKRNPNNRKLIRAINDSDRKKIYEHMDNALYDASLEFAPEMNLIIEKLVNEFQSKKAMMTGTGSTIFAIFEDDSSLQRAYEYFSKKYKDVYITTTAKEAIEVEVVK
ncbi:MAG: 4-(cytidine 5'-diphospho)-2-C-methyl-D-erythritol kinase [Proteocatella sp.]